MAKKKAEAKEEAAEEEAQPEPEEPKKVTHKKLKVNFWRTGLHKEELGPYQTVKYQAKTTFFSKSFEIEGIVEEDGEKKYVIAYNKEEWHDDPEDKKRLILRLFTIMEEGLKVGKGGTFKGGLELSVSHSIIQSFEIKDPAPVFFVQIPRSSYITKIVKGRRMAGTRWTWPLLPEKDEDMLQMVRAKGVVGMGLDYDIYIGKKKIAKIDGQRIQKEWEIEIYDETYAKDKTFVMYLILFACVCNFMKDSEKMIKKLYTEMKDTGTSSYKMPYYEQQLFKNPRMMRK